MPQAIVRENEDYFWFMHVDCPEYDDNRITSIWRSEDAALAGFNEFADRLESKRIPYTITDHTHECEEQDLMFSITWANGEGWIGRGVYQDSPCFTEKE